MRGHSIRGPEGGKNRVPIDDLSRCRHEKVEKLGFAHRQNERNTVDDDASRQIKMSDASSRRRLRRLGMGDDDRVE